MPSAAINKTLQDAIQHHTAGRLAQAEALYRQILSQRPNHADALHLLGVIASQAKQYDAAIDLIRRAIAIQPRNAACHSNLGNVYREAGRLDEAIASFQRAVELSPQLAEVHSNLGNALHQQGRLDEAIAACRRALQLKPVFPEAHNNLGNALRSRGLLDDAITSYQQALALKADYVEAHNNLGNALHEAGQLDESIASFQRAIVLKPDFAQAHSNLASALNDQGRIEEAIASWRRALQLKPDHAQALNNIASALKDLGQLDEAIAGYRRALAINPSYAAAHSNLVYTLSFHPSYDDPAILREAQEWYRQHALPLKPSIPHHDNDPNPKRRLRIGYVSPDFKNHPVGRFLLPLLGAHDHQNFEVFCYSSTKGAADDITSQLRASADVWRDVANLSDTQLAACIASDHIDILIDVTMHMAHNRLLVFARKPVPVQVTYLAYSGTTGLSTIDYRLTDPHLDPPGMDETHYTEKSVRLPDSYWCYQPHNDVLVTTTPPALRIRHITFGCFNNFCKLSPPTLALWRQLMQNLPGSCLIVHAFPGSHRDRLLGFMAEGGIAAGRIEFSGNLPATEYFKQYGRIDIALDPFPYGGGTTTCDALWMGVPVVTLAGQTAVGRGGVSILSNTGLPELIAKTQQDYLDIAANLARDLPRLAHLRSTLRDRLRSSPLMDAPRFARNVELAYREMWRNWCSSQSVHPING